MTIAAILTRAQALAEADRCSCAHLTITLAAHRLDCFDLAEGALQLYARANDLTPAPVITDCGSIHNFWDAADQAARDASWARARAAAMGRGR